MADLFVKTGGNFSALTFQDVVASNTPTYPGGGGNNEALSTTRYITFTPSAGGTCEGVFLSIFRTGAYNDSNYVTATLQEQTAPGVWTDRATVTRYVANGDMVEDGMLGEKICNYFEWGTPYVITAVASTWRISVSGSGVSINISTAGNYGYAVVLTSTSSFTSGDNIWVKERQTIVIDQSITFGVWQCGYKDIIQWKNPPVASYTLTGTTLWLANYCDFHVGTEAKPIPYAQKAIINITTFKSESGWNKCGNMSLKLWGEEPVVANVWTRLNGDANSGQAVITTESDMSDVWSATDQIYVTGGPAKNSNCLELKTISTVVGTAVTFTSNLAVTHTDGYWAINRTLFEKCGIELKSTISLSILRDFEVVGVYVSTGTNIGVSETFNELTFIVNSAITPRLMRSVYNVTGGPIHLLWSIASPNASVTCTIQSCFNIDANNVGGNIAFPTGIPVTYSANYHREYTRNLNFSSYNVTIENSCFDSMGTATDNSPIHIVAGSDYLIDNCRLGGGDDTIRVTSVVNLTLRDTILKGANNYNIDFNQAINVEIDNCTFSGATADLRLNAYYAQVKVKGGSTFTVASDSIANAVIGSYIKASNFGGDTADHRTWWKYGNTYSVGTGLTDATAHTAGGYAVRFLPLSSASNMTWDFTIPTGNIQNKTMMVGVWCKIASATYYAGTHQLPRLTIDYDNGTAAYVQASETTDWQFLPLPFTPTTTYGQITVTLSGRTDATTTDAYVYWDDFKCYDEKTEVLTYEGWKFFKEVKIGEKLVTLNPTNWNIEYQPVTHKLERKVDTKMYAVQGQAIDMVVTPDHSLWVQERNSDKWVLKQAMELKDKTYRIAKTGNWTGEEQEYFEIPATTRKLLNRWYGSVPFTIKSKQVKMDDWLEFMGYYLSEGCCFRHGTKAKPKCHYSVVICQKDREVFDRMVDVVKRMDFNPYIWQHPTTGVWNYKIANKQLYDYLEQFGHAEDKFIPTEIKQVSKRQLQILLDALIVGDGWVIQKDKSAYLTVSKRLADDVQEVMFKCGYATIMSERPREKEYYFPQYVIKQLDRVESVVNADNDRKNPKAQIKNNDQYIDYKGMVYCVTVAKNHILYVRRNGKVMWSGNCLYPAETPLNTQTFDLWADGLPVTPPIATVLSANDVWSASSAVDYGANTMGELIKTTEKKVDDNSALIIST